MTLTVVMPAYNEEGCIADAVAEVRKHVLDVVADSQLIVINDGSKDGTGRVLDALAARDSHVRVVHQVNGGHGAALRTGLESATTDWLFLIDSDQQIPLTAFAELWKLAQQGDGAFGLRRQRRDASIRIVLTKIIRNVVAIFFGVKIYDPNVPFKILRRKIWTDARAIIPAGTLAPSLFLAIFAQKKRFRIAQMDVPHVDRRTGEVSIKRWKLFKFCAKAFGQLLRFRMRL